MTTRSVPSSREAGTCRISHGYEVLYDQVPYELAITQSQPPAGGEGLDGPQEIACHLTLTPEQVARLDTGQRFHLTVADGRGMDFYLLDRAGWVTPASGFGL